MDLPAEIVNLEALQPGYWTTFGPLGLMCLVFLIAFGFLGRWAINKIDASQAQILEIQKSHQLQLEATHTLYGERMQRIHGEYTDRMEEIAKDFKQVVAANTQA